jgi:3-isopropylmalate/(R)-2-methylmalate dehydratase small subunit
MSFKHLGVGAILAASYGRIFYRNALNFGIPTLIFPDADEIHHGDRLQVDPIAGVIENLSSEKSYTVAALPQHLMAMVTAGGLMPYLKQRLAQDTN